MVDSDLNRVVQQLGGIVHVQVVVHAVFGVVECGPTHQLDVELCQKGGAALNTVTHAVLLRRRKSVVQVTVHQVLATFVGPQSSNMLWGVVRVKT